MPHIDTIKNAETQLRETLTKLRERTKAHQDKLNELRKSEIYGADYRAKLIKDEREAFTAEMTGLRQEHDSAVQTVRALPQAVIGEVSKRDSSASTEEQLLAEMQTQRSWNRYRGLLDASKDDITSVLNTVTAEGLDAATVRALTDELPAYLNSNGLPSEVMDEVHASLIKHHPEGSAIQSAVGLTGKWDDVATYNFSVAEQHAAGEQYVPDFVDYDAASPGGGAA